MPVKEDPHTTSYLMSLARDLSMSINEPSYGIGGVQVEQFQFEFLNE
jgi:hypothetical protein